MQDQFVTIFYGVFRLKCTVSSAPSHSSLSNDANRLVPLATTFAARKPAGAAIWLLMPLSFVPHPFGTRPRLAIIPQAWPVQEQRGERKVHSC